MKMRRNWFPRQHEGGKSQFKEIQGSLDLTAVLAHVIVGTVWSSHRTFIKINVIMTFTIINRQEMVFITTSAQQNSVLINY